jgi:hypothetical protein
MQDALIMCISETQKAESPGMQPPGTEVPVQQIGPGNRVHCYYRDASVENLLLSSISQIVLFSF